MNEQYLSRGKRVDNGKWVEGFVILYEHRGNKFAQILNDFNDSNEKETSYNMIRVDPATVGRCTGLRDKNGTLIFEGDICKDSIGWIFKVTWDIECARFIGFHSKPRGNTYICYVSREPEVKIIGNIHDTPELLKEV